MPYKDSDAQKLRRQKYAEEHRTEARERARLWAINNPEKVKLHRIKARPANAARMRVYSQVNKEKRRIYRQKNRDELRVKEQLYRINNREQVRERSRRYHKERRLRDPNYKIITNLRGRLYRAIRFNAKVGSAVSDLGCSVQQFRDYIASLFLPGMSWENWGEWHLDHKRPLASFDLADRAQFLQACHYSNMQPLWALDNIKKNAKYAA